MSELFYSKDHEWIRFEDATTATIGVSKFAVEQLGDIVHIEINDMGSEVEAEDSFGTIESTKTVSDLYLPISGTITAINEDLIESPESLQGAEDGTKWLAKIKYTKKDRELMSDTEYQKFIED